MKFFTQSSVLSPQPFDFLWLILLVAYILVGTPLVPFHGDESTQVYMSRDYAYQFLQGDLSKIYYSKTPASPQEQELRLLNGTVNKYLIGLSWHLGGFTLADVNEQWDWGGDWNYNQQNSHAPSSALLLVARWPSAIFLAAGVVVIFVLGRMLGGRLTAYLASAYCALNPALLLDGRRAMMEGSLTFFSLLTALAGIWFLRRPSWQRALALGAAAGLALASKHTAVFAVAGVFAACLLKPHPQPLPVSEATGEGRELLGVGISSTDGQKPVPTNHDGSVGTAFLPSELWRIKYLPLKEGRERVLGLRSLGLVKRIALLALAGLVTAGVFLALNPAWWDNPAARLGKVLELRQNLLAGQTAAFGGYKGAADQAAGFLRQTFVVLPQYYEAPSWSGYIGDQIAAYEASPWHGISLGGSLPGAAALAALLILGVWRLRSGSMDDAARWVVGLWALAVAVSTLALTPIEWQRYYLPIYPVVGLLAALGVHLRRGSTHRSNDPAR